MKQIYLVLTYTGTILSKVVKLYTKKKYAHVSISLDADLEHLYSFGRLNPYNPFIGGFVREGVNIGTFKRFKDTKAKIIAMEITDKQYNQLARIIKLIEHNRKKYGFNTLGLFAVMFNKKIRKKNKFYCAEFVKYVLTKSGVKVDFPILITPEDFAKIGNTQLFYEGLLRHYNLQSHPLSLKIS